MVEKKDIVPPHLTPAAGETADDGFGHYKDNKYET